MSIEQYIKERIEMYSDDNNDLFWGNGREEVINELQTVLSKIEEIQELNK